jgi:hypothetical protein
MARVSDGYIYRRGSSPNTKVAISQKNRVFSIPFQQNSFKQIGVLSTFDWSESRAVDPVRGVGFGDKIQELVPGVTEPMTLTLNRTLLYTASIAQEVGYAGGVDGLVRSLRQHKWPFDIRSELVFSELISQGAEFQNVLVQTPGSDGGFALITRYEACWLNSISASFPSDSAIVVEDASATCTDVLDGLPSFYGPGPLDYGDNLESGNNPFNTANGGGSALFTGA